MNDVDRDDDIDEIEGLRILDSDDDDLDEIDLPHWTEPGTGEIPITGDRDDDWAALSGSEPRWADDDPYDDDYLDDDPPEPIRIASTEDEFFAYDDDVYDDEPPPDRRPIGAPLGARPRSDRNLGEAVLTGGLLGAIALVCFWLGRVPTLILVTAALGLAATEFFDTLRKRGYQPATLLGLAGVVAAPLATYWRYEAGIPTVLFLTMFFGAVWYLAGVNTERPVPNLGVTMLGIVYVGIMGSFAALIIRLPDGISLLFCTILVTIAYDIGAYFVGRAVGRSPLSEASPNKTVEGLLGGMLAAAAVGLVVLGLFEIDPFADPIDGLVFGLVIAVVAPIGDLAESLMKRDLGVKDMGSVLPGHGGLLDRFDALLFVLPAAYYAARLIF